MRQVKQGSNRRPGKGIKATNGYLHSSFGVTTQRSTTYILLPTSVNPGKTGILPSSPDQAQQKSGRADISKNSHLLLASAIFPTMPSGANGVSRWVSSWSSAICGENNFPFSLWWVLSWDPFFSRTRHNRGSAYVGWTFSRAATVVEDDLSSGWLACSALKQNLIHPRPHGGSTVCWTWSGFWGGPSLSVGARTQDLPEIYPWLPEVPRKHELKESRGCLCPAACCSWGPAGVLFGFLFRH